MTETISRELLRLLTALRQSNSVIDAPGYYIAAGRCWGYLAALHEAELINIEQHSRLRKLIVSAIEHCWRPFPDARNAGPVMPAFVRLGRAAKARSEVHEDAGLIDTVRSRLGGPTVSVDVDDLIAEARSDEKPGSVSAPTPRPELRLLCLLCQKTGAYQPVATLHPMPPRTLLPRRWTDAADQRALGTCKQYLPLGYGFYLSPSPTHVTPAEVLARCLRQRQANALRPALGSVRAGRVSHAR